MRACDDSPERRERLEMRPHLSKTRENNKFPAAAFELALLERPGGRMRNKHSAQPGLQSGINVTPRTVPHHPTVRFDDFELLHHALVRTRILFQHDFDRIEVRLESRALHFACLLCGLALRQKYQAVMLREIGKRFGHAIKNVRWRGFEFDGHPLDFLNHFPARGVSRELQIRIFERAAKTSHAIAVLPDVSPLSFVQNMANVFAGVAEVFELADEVLNRLLEENIIFPERVIGVDQQRVSGHSTSSPNLPSGEW